MRKLVAGTPTRAEKAALEKAVATAKKSRSDLQSLYARSKSGIVRVMVKLAPRGPKIGSGTGFFVSKTGLVVTNWHVISHPKLDSIHIRGQGGQEVVADILALHEQADLAVLKPVEAIRVDHVFVGVPLADVHVGATAVSIGFPSGLRFSLTKGVVSGIRSPEEVQQAVRKSLGWASPLEHPYKYVQTDAGLYYGSSGGPLLDEKGRVLGVSTLGIPGAAIAFAVEWAAVADLLKKAKQGRAIGLDDIRRRSKPTFKVRRLFGEPATATQVAGAAKKARESIYCGRCVGTGRIREKTPTERTVPGRTVSGDPAPRRVKGWKVAWARCPNCQGSGVTPVHGRAYARLCHLVEVLARLDESSHQADLAKPKALAVFRESALDNAWLAGKFADSCRAVLGSPQKHVGSPVVFFGMIDEMLQGKEATYLLVRVYGSRHHLVVVSRVKVTALRGTWCQVAGLVGGAAHGVGWVAALDVSGIRANPKLRAR